MGHITIPQATHGFLLNAGSFTTIDFPGAATGTVAGDINDSGQIVANYGDASGNAHGFLLSAGNFSAIDFPGAFSSTGPSGISANGQIVGSYDDSNGALHGFLLSGAKFSTLDFPNVFSTLANRVNAVGQIVGIYFFFGQHGFMLQRKALCNILRTESLVFRQQQRATYLIAAFQGFWIRLGVALLQERAAGLIDSPALGRVVFRF